MEFSASLFYKFDTLLGLGLLRHIRVSKHRLELAHDHVTDRLANVGTLRNLPDRILYRLFLLGVPAQLLLLVQFFRGIEGVLDIPTTQILNWAGSV